MDKTWIMNNLLKYLLWMKNKNKDKIHSLDEMWMMMDESSSMDKNEHT